jgi:hypothetical protein
MEQLEEAKKRDHRKLGQDPMPLAGTTAQYIGEE